MTIGANAKQDEIESTADDCIVFAAMADDVATLWVESVKGAGRQINSINQLAPQRV